ncbi:hypothetical protein HNP46_006978 [Pseudomonas nitritireducens]|uniref:Phage tail tape measure protein n=1 Tax=Pseudomonas nitroreducens TaxID=46680 RepID=A0A7W7KT02_PSENT|nr:hypothetical protein [Pseudomonas nitritireducens]
MIGPEVGEALGQSLGLALKDSLGVAIADALSRWEGARVRGDAARVGASAPVSELHRPLHDAAQQGDDLAQQTLDALQEIATLLRESGSATARPVAGQLGGAGMAVALQPVAYEWSKKESILPEALSGPKEAAVAGLRSALLYEQRVQEISVRGGLAPGAESERGVAKRVEAAARDSGLDANAALDMTRLLMNSGLTLERSLQYLPAAAKFQYGKAIAPEAVVDLVANISRQGDLDAAGVERGLGVISWRARQENVSTEQLVRRLNGGQDARSWTEVTRLPGQMRVAPAVELQAAVDARRNTTQGQRTAAQVALERTLQTGGSVALRTVDVALPMVTDIADGLSRSASLDGARAAVATLQFGLAQDMAADFVEQLGYAEQARKIRSLNLNPLQSPATMGNSRPQVRPDAAKGLPSAGALPAPWLPSLPSVGGVLRRYVENQVLGPVSPVPLNGPLLPLFADRLPALRPGSHSAEAQASTIEAILGGGLFGALLLSPPGSLMGSTLGVLSSLRREETPQAVAPGASSDEVMRPAEPVPDPGRGDSASRVSPAGQNWTFSPQISINVAGNVSDPDQLANELLPRLRRMLADFSQDRQRDALFDMVVV